MTRTRAHRLGTAGEALAARYMAERGFRVLERRFRRRGGEIDLVCATGETTNEVVFVEVKTRSGRSFGRPEAAVSPLKRKRMRRTAEVFLHEYGLSNVLVRFDVIAIIRYGSAEPQIQHLAAAFDIHELMDEDIWNEWRLR